MGASKAPPKASLVYKLKTAEQYNPDDERFTAMGITHLVLFMLLMMICSLTLFAYYRDSCDLGHHICEAQSPYTPNQLHISLGRNDSEYFVTWSTDKPVDSLLVWYKHEPHRSLAIEQEMRVAKLAEREMIDPSNERLEIKYKKYSYRAAMNVELGYEYLYKVVACAKKTRCLADASPAVRLYYCCDPSHFYTSNSYKFTPKNFSDPHRQLNIAFYGDLGLLNAQSVPRLTEDVLKNSYDLIIHNGDFAYDLNTEKGTYGDRFMRLIEPVAARLPYQTSVGNHEIAHNFSEYDHRFTMIDRGPIRTGQLNNFFYSFDAGPVHFIAFSTEFYYFLSYCGMEPLVNQYDWLKQDLAHANAPEQRALRPWIIVYGHRPMYCSSRDKDDCTKDTNLLRRGLPFTGAFALEKLFYESGVDVEMYSHEHQYERFLPIFDSKVYPGSENDPYQNPKAPVHIISGSAGCQERLDPFEQHSAPGSVKKIADYGYTRLSASKCKLHFQQVSDDQDGTIVDEFTMTKTRQNFPEISSIADFDC